MLELPYKMPLAHQFANYLIQNNYTNVYVIEDYHQTLEESQIIVQKGDFQSANNLKDLLGIGHLESNSTGSLDSDLTIRVGEDWLQKANIH
jgi:polyisoprenyl-teichoic acid--peptidoglycan teichoic acid transferase